MASRLFVVAGRQEYRQGDKRLSMIAPVIFWLEAKGGRSGIYQISTWYLKPMPPMPWSVWNALKCVGYCLTCWFRPRQWSHRGGLVQAVGSSKGCQVQFYSAVSICLDLTIIKYTVYVCIRIITYLTSVTFTFFQAMEVAPVTPVANFKKLPTAACCSRLPCHDISWHFMTFPRFNLELSN